MKIPGWYQDEVLAVVVARIRGQDGALPLVTAHDPLGEVRLFDPSGRVRAVRVPAGILGVALVDLPPAVIAAS